MSDLTKDEILTLLAAARRLHMDAADAHKNGLPDAVDTSLAAHQATVHFGQQIDSSYTPSLFRWSIEAKMVAAAYPHAKSVPNKHRKVARELIRINEMLRTDL
jgi:hypothetical protein